MDKAASSSSTIAPPSHRDGSSVSYLVFDQNLGADRPEVLLVMPPANESAAIPMGAFYLLHGLKSAGIPARLLDFLPMSKRAELAELNWGQVLCQPGAEAGLRQADSFLDAHPSLAEGLCTALLEQGCKIVGFSVTDLNLYLSLALSRRLKRLDPHVKVVMGGPAITERTQGLQAFTTVDYCLRGDGDRAFALLCRRVLRGEFPTAGEIPGLVVPGADEGAASLAEVAIPDEVVDYSLALSYPAGLFEHQAIPVNYSRGCANRCAFCSNPGFFGSFRHSPTNVFLAQLGHVEELMEREGRFWSRAFRFNDPAINGDPVAFKELISGMRVFQGRFRFSAELVLGGGHLKGQLQACRDVGFDHFMTGVESGSERMRRLMRKPGRLDEIRGLAKEASDLGIELSMNFIVGWPGETQEDFDETRRFIREMAQTLSRVSMIINPLMISDRTYARERAWHSFIRGDRLGVFWQGDCPSGDPRERSDRFQSLYEEFKDVLNTYPSVPLDYYEKFRPQQDELGSG